MRLTFDLEANGLRDTVTCVHCLVIRDVDTGDVFTYIPSEIDKGVAQLQECLDNGGQIIGHNIIDYDIPVLRDLHNLHVSYEQQTQCVDTLVMSRVIYSNLKDTDFSYMRRGILPGVLLGSHSLKAWGLRLGELKGDYGVTTDDAWETFSQEMLDYCVQDVNVTTRLFKKLSEENLPEDVLITELKAMWLMTKQKELGFPFDVEKARELERTLRARKATLQTKLLALVPRIPDKIFIPKRNNKTKGYIKGVPIQRYKDFNPNSRQQIEWVFSTYFKYEPDNPDLYEEDRLKIDENTLTFVSQDPLAPQELQEVAATFSEYLMLSKRLGQLIDGKYGWLKVVNEADKCIHGSVNPCGAITGRATHSSPNVAQVPAINSPYGAECRELFKAQEGWYQAGIDASGLELRCLAHYLYPYDEGAYAHEILNGDIHTANMKAAGLTERNQAKTFNTMEVYKTIEFGEPL